VLGTVFGDCTELIMGCLGAVSEERYHKEELEEEQVWENRKRREGKDLVPCKEALARMESVPTSD